MTHLFNHCLRLSRFPKPWKKTEAKTLPKPARDPKFSQNLRQISLFSTTGKLFEKVILKIDQRHIEEIGLLNGSQIGFHARHRTTLQCMRVRDVTLNFNNDLYMDAVFLDIEKAFDTIWQFSLLCKLSELKFSISQMKLISSLPSLRTFRVSVEGEISTLRDIRVQAGVPQSSELFPTLYSLYINERLNTWCLSRSLYDDTCIYATNHKEFIF
jgi:hypothetical protein